MPAASVQAGVGGWGGHAASLMRAAVEGLVVCWMLLMTQLQTYVNRQYF